MSTGLPVCSTTTVFGFASITASMTAPCPQGRLRSALSWFSDSILIPMTTATSARRAMAAASAGLREKLLQLTHRRRAGDGQPAQPGKDAVPTQRNIERETADRIGEAGAAAPADHALVGVAADHGYGLDIRLERQHALVLKQNDAALCHLSGGSQMRLDVGLR